MGKLLEEMILQSLQGRMVDENGLSENQFSLRKGTVDYIQAVVGHKEEMTCGAPQVSRVVGERGKFEAALCSSVLNKCP